MMCRAAIWLPDASRGLCEIRGEKLIDGVLNALREHHVFEVVILTSAGYEELEAHCRAQHLELMLQVFGRDEHSGSAYRLYDARDALTGPGELLLVDGRVTFEAPLIRKLIDTKGSACAVELEAWDANSTRAAVELGRVTALSTNLTRKMSSGRSLGFYKLDKKTIDEMSQSISQQLSYSGDVSMTVEQVIDRLLKSRRIELKAVPIDAGSWFLVDQLEQRVDEAVERF